MNEEPPFFPSWQAQSPPGASSACSNPLRDTKSPLVRDAVAGDSEAVGILLERARPFVYGWALQRTRDPDEAEDISQTVLLRAYSGLSSFGGRATLSSWLYRITLNEISAFCRKEARLGRCLRNAHFWTEAWTEPPKELEKIDTALACDVVRTVASALPPLQIAAFRLVDLEGYRPCEVSKELGRSQTNIRSSLCRARKKVRELVRRARKELAEDRTP